MAYQAAKLLVEQGLLNDKVATITRDEQERLSRRYLSSWFNYFLRKDNAYYPFIFGPEAQKDLASGKLSTLQSQEK